MKSLIPWKKRNREMDNLRKDFDDLCDRFFSESVFSMPKLFSEKSWYPNVAIFFHSSTRCGSSNGR